MTLPSTSPVDSSRVEDGKEIRTFSSIQKLQSFVKESRVREEEGKPLKNHIYYCENCNNIFILPSWFSSFYLERLGPDPREFLKDHLECCGEPKILFLILPEESPSFILDIGLGFTPYWKESELWIISDQWLSTRLVIKDLL